MKDNLKQSIADASDALTGKKSLPVQIVSWLSLVLVSVFVVFIVLWVAKLSGVSESFLRLLGILLSPTVIICALVLYLWRQLGQHILGLISRITKVDIGGLLCITTQPNKMDSILPRIKSDNKSEASPSDTVTSSGSSDNFNEIKKKAMQGDARAQSNLGFLYDNGKGVEQNHAKAAKWFRLAADKGYAKAQFNLGVLYYKGAGVKQNHTEAAECFRLAAEQGYVDAQFNLGVLYYNGEGVEQSHTEAAKWLRLAAKQGNAKAQFNLGVLYYSGEGVEQSHTEAAEWYSLAAKQGHAKAQVNLGLLYRSGERVEQNRAKAAKWFHLAAKQEVAEAQFNLGVSYYNGEGVEQNRAKAAKWFHLAAKQGHAKAQFNLGVSYYNGEGVAQNYSEAYIWFSLAFAGNAPDARKARDQVIQQLDLKAMNDAQAEATRREEEIRRKRKGESQ